MGRIGILASGSGTNFQNIVEKLIPTEHYVAVLITDKKNAYAIERGKKLGIPSFYVPYFVHDRQKSEEEMTALLDSYKVDIVVLAGFMRLLTPWFVKRWKGRLINIHPALLPKHPGAHGIKDSYDSDDSTLGVTVHYVDEGMDTGPIIDQASFQRYEGMSYEEAEEQIHQLEYNLYPNVIIKLLTDIK